MQADQNAASEPDGGDRQEQVAALEQRLAQLDAFVESVRDYALVMFDLDNRVTGWNAGAQQILGYSEREVLGQPGAIFFTPEDRATGQPGLEVSQAYRDGRAEDERWHVRKDGRRFWGSGVMSRLSDKQGTHCGYAKVFRDMTEQKLAEERVRQSEEQFRLFSESVTDYALVLADTEHRVSGWNTGAERTLGYTAAEAIGLPFDTFFRAVDVREGRSENDFETALNQGRSEVELWLVRKNGTIFWARWVTTPMREPGGKLRGFAKVLHDETERKKAQEQREVQEEAQRESLESRIRQTGEALDRTKEELRALAGSLLRAQEEERRRIARELHDDLLQQLAMLEVRVAQLRQTAPEKDSAAFLLVESQIASLAAGVRELSHELHPSILEDLGLPVALESLSEQFKTLLGEQVRFELRNVPDEVPPEVGSVLYRVAQEALMNVVKHAGPVPVTVILDQQEGALRLQIKDAGPGFDPEAARAKGGIGIISMQERASLVGATLRLKSSSSGTTVEVTVAPRPEGQ